MEQITFDKLPEAVGRLFLKLDSIEQLLRSHSADTQIEQDVLLTIQQASELINLSVPTIYGLVSKGDIPVSKKGKRLYFSKKELLAWIQSGRKKTNAEIQAEATNYTNGKRK